MKASRIVLVALLFTALLSGCARKSEDLVIGPYTPSISSPIKVKVADVSNNTGQLFDVDVIGLLWSGLEDSLRKRGMLWVPELGGQPYTLEARVVKFKKGGMGWRLLPRMGDTLLVAQCDIKSDGRVIATIESTHQFSFGRETFTRAAWKKVFAEVSEDIINQAARKF
jgi:hypothetical protein